MKLKQYDKAIADYSKSCELCQDDYGKSLYNASIKNAIGLKKLEESKTQLENNLSVLFEQKGLNITVEKLIMSLKTTQYLFS